MAGGSFTRCPACKRLMLTGQQCPFSEKRDHKDHVPVTWAGAQALGKTWAGR